VLSIVRTADDLALFPKIALRLLEREKRRQGRVKLHDAIHSVVGLIKPFVGMYKARIELNLTDTEPEIFGSVAAVESILMNLLTNALNAFVANGSIPRERIVSIRTELQRNENVILRVLDSGPGIIKLTTDEIWLPGHTTSPDGTGLGLTIVRDSVLDLGGRVAAVPQGELGGAEFVIRLPLARDRQN